MVSVHVSHTHTLCFCISRQVSRHHADFASQSSSSPPSSSPPSSVVSSPPKTSAGTSGISGTSSQLPGRHTAARRLSRDQRSLRGAKGEARKGVSREAAASRIIEERAVDHRLRDMPSEWERPSVVAEEAAVESRTKSPSKPSNPSKRQTTTTTTTPPAAPSVSFTSSVGARTPPRSRSVPPGGTRVNNTNNTGTIGGGSGSAFMQVRIRIRQCIVQFVACDIVCMLSLIWWLTLAFSVRCVPWCFL